MAKDKEPTLEEQVADLKLQLEAAHADRIAAEEERDKAVAALSGTPKEGATDLDQYKGKYLERTTGEVYGLKVMKDEDVRNGKTHHVKNEKFFGDYTKEEFMIRFEKV